MYIFINVIIFNKFEGPKSKIILVPREVTNNMNVFVLRSVEITELDVTINVITKKIRYLQLSSGEKFIDSF